LWDPKTGRERSVINDQYSRGVWGLAISPDGKTIAEGKKIGIYIFDAATGQRRAVNSYLYSPFPYSLAYSPDGTLLAASRGDGNVQILDAESLQERTLLRHDVYPGWLISVAFAPDGKTVAAIGTSGRGFLWNATTGERQANFETGCDIQTSFAFSSDGKTLFTASAEGIKLIYVAGGKETKSWGGDAGAVVSVAAAPDGKTVAAADAKGTVTLWDVATGKARDSFKAHPDGHCCLRFSADSKMLLTWNQIANWG